MAIVARTPAGRWGAVDDMVAMALARAKPLTREHSVEVAVERELPLVRIDARAVAEVIYLLMDNATKYSPPATRIRVAASRAAGGS